MGGLPMVSNRIDTTLDRGLIWAQSSRTGTTASPAGWDVGPGEVSGQPTFIQHVVNNYFGPARARGVTKVEIRRLTKHSLRRPLQVLVQPDGPEFLACAPDLSEVFGVGATAAEAIEYLKAEIEDLHEEFRSGEAFAENWDSCKEFLTELVLEGE